MNLKKFWCYNDIIFRRPCFHDTSRIHRFGSCTYSPISWGHCDLDHYPFSSSAPRSCQSLVQIHLSNAEKPELITSEFRELTLYELWYLAIIKYIIYMVVNIYHHYRVFFLMCGLNRNRFLIWMVTLINLISLFSFNVIEALYPIETWQIKIKKINIYRRFFRKMPLRKY